MKIDTKLQKFLIANELDLVIRFRNQWEVELVRPDGSLHRSFTGANLETILNHLILTLTVN